MASPQMLSCKKFQNTVDILAESTWMVASENWFITPNNLLVLPLKIGKLSPITKKKLSNVWESNHLGVKYLWSP